MQRSNQSSETESISHCKALKRNCPTLERQPGNPPPTHGIRVLPPRATTFQPRAPPNEPPVEQPRSRRRRRRLTCVRSMGESSSLAKSMAAAADHHHLLQCRNHLQPYLHHLHLPPSSSSSSLPRDAA